MCSTFLICVGGSVALIFLRSKLNADFANKHAVCLTYSLPYESRVRYKRLLQSLDHLANAEMLEIVLNPAGRYEHVGSAALSAELPKYVICNLDVYCLITRPEKYYLLPDCILVATAGSYYTLKWTKVSLETNNIAGSFEITEYHSVLVHGRYRKDGGLDRRYNSQFQQVPRSVMRPIAHYGVLSFAFGKDKRVILTTGKSAVHLLDKAIDDWLETH
jgi:hypothetical protein